MNRTHIFLALAMGLIMGGSIGFTGGVAFNKKHFSESVYQLGYEQAYEYGLDIADSGYRFYENGTLVGVLPVDSCGKLDSLMINLNQ